MGDEMMLGNENASDVGDAAKEILNLPGNTADAVLNHSGEFSSHMEEILNLTHNAKYLKEEFVSYTSGTLPIEIFLMALVTLSSFALFSIFKLISRKFLFESYLRTFAFVIENVIIVIPMLLSFTVLSDKLLLISVLLNGIVCCLVYFLCMNHHRKFLTRLWNCKCSDMKLNYLTNYKANIQLTTAICILAVDFHVFPRRFAKAEVYGIGVMDMGVGTIVFSHALSSSQARLQEKVNIAGLLSNLKSSSVLVLLGLLRMLLVKETNYQEHVVEYGEHWNFFFTLATMKPIANIILWLLNTTSRQSVFLCLSFVSIVMYQISLSKYGLEGVIQDGLMGDKSRSTFVDANREGIFSCFGYLSIYFCGLFFGKQLYKKTHSLYNKLFWLACWFMTGYVCMSLCVQYVTPISRQMANIGYFFIQIAFNALLLFGFLLLDMICYALQSIMFPTKQERVVEVFQVPGSYLAQSISANLLVYFLLANVLTGLVNITFDTLQCSSIKSVGILISYIGILNNIVWTVSIIQQRHGIRKFNKD